jgi:hypothetical protein
MIGSAPQSDDHPFNIPTAALSAMTYNKRLELTIPDAQHRKIAFAAGEWGQGSFVGIEVAQNIVNLGRRHKCLRLGTQFGGTDGESGTEEDTGEQLENKILNWSSLYLCWRALQHRDEQTRSMPPAVADTIFNATFDKLEEESGLTVAFTDGNDE